MTITTTGGDVIRKKLQRERAYLERGGLMRTIGSVVESAVRVAIKRLPNARQSAGWKRTQQWERSVRHDAAIDSVYVFYDLAVAVYARIRELGGEIRAFRSKFKIGAAPALFVPLVPNAHPADWKNLTRGVDFVLARSVRHPATHVMERTITAELGTEKSKTRTAISAAMRRIWGNA